MTHTVLGPQSMFDGGAAAVFSDDDVFRYRLWREWGPGPTMAFIMLNPSVADAFRSDNTVTRCMGFARREGCGRLEVVNLYAFRSPYPKVMAEAMRAGVDITGGVENVAAIETVVTAPDTTVVAAWGETMGAHAWDVAHGYLDGLDVDLWCLGTTVAGHPRHPLYLPGDAPLTRFELRTRQRRHWDRQARREG